MLELLVNSAAKRPKLVTVGAGLFKRSQSVDIPFRSSAQLQRVWAARMEAEPRMEEEGYPRGQNGRGGTGYSPVLVHSKLPAEELPPLCHSGFPPKGGVPDHRQPIGRSERHRRRSRRLQPILLCFDLCLEILNLGNKVFNRLGELGI